MSSQHPRLTEVLQRDRRYPIQAYAFVVDGLSHTQRLLGRVPPDPVREADMGKQYHVSGPELLRGICDLAWREFGLLARTVFRLWGIQQTDDIGNIIFNLIEAQLLCKTDSDRREDFHAVFDLDDVLRTGYVIPVDGLPENRRGSEA